MHNTTGKFSTVQLLNEVNWWAEWANVPECTGWQGWRSWWDDWRHMTYVCGSMTSLHSSLTTNRHLTRTAITRRTCIFAIQCNKTASNFNKSQKTLSCRRRSAATRCVAFNVLYTKVDAQCDELATVVGRTKLSTLTLVDVLWRNFS